MVCRDYVDHVTGSDPIDGVVHIDKWVLSEFGGEQSASKIVFGFCHIFNDNDYELMTIILIFKMIKNKMNDNDNNA